MPRDVDLVRNDSSVQPFIEQQVRAVWNLFPIREGAFRRSVERLLFAIVHVVARFRGPDITVGPEDALKLRKQVGVLTEMRERHVPVLSLFLDHLRLHLFAVIAMEGVALDKGGIDFFTAEDLLERAPD